MNHQFFRKPAMESQGVTGAPDTAESRTPGRVLDSATEPGRSAEAAADAEGATGGLGFDENILDGEDSMEEGSVTEEGERGTEMEQTTITHPQDSTMGHKIPDKKMLEGLGHGANKTHTKGAYQEIFGSVKLPDQFNSWKRTASLPGSSDKHQDSRPRSSGWGWKRDG